MPIQKAKVPAKKEIPILVQKIPERPKVLTTDKEVFRLNAKPSFNRNYFFE